MVLPTWLKLVVGVSGVFFTFAYFAVLQQDVFRKEYDGEKFKDTLFMMACERSMNTIVAGVAILIMGGSGNKAPIVDLSVSGVTQMISMTSSNEALKHISYTTQVLCKSCKMVPVFIFGIILAGKGKEYGLVDYLKVAVVTGGVLVFNFGKPKNVSGSGADQNMENFGMALIAVSLTLDGFTGGLQDKAKKAVSTINKDPTAQLTPYEMMFWGNFSGAIFAVLVAGGTGQLQSGFAFCMRSPALFQAILTFAACSACGQVFIFLLLSNFGALVTTTVTTTRKIFSTVYSTFRDPNGNLAEMQWYGCYIVFGGILWDMYLKFTKKKAPKAEKASKKTD